MLSFWFSRLRGKIIKDTGENATLGISPITNGQLTYTDLEITTSNKHEYNDLYEITNATEQGTYTNMQARDPKEHEYNVTLNGGGSCSQTYTDQQTRYSVEHHYYEISFDETT